ncbi:MAG: rhodanese-like domain-containing protein [Burkholderiaceae bacterium]|jgi:rhodanese-related sulfurtransferase|nr:rhodanese-like domain-containing protein [Burkholderiaceae bacterium]
MTFDLDVSVREYSASAASRLDHSELEAQALARSVSPPQAWALFQSGKAVLVDVRTAEERKFVGHVPDTLHVPWATGTSMTRNPRFVRELEAKLAPHGGKDAVLLLLCRSGKRSALAQEVVEKAGFAHVFNVLEGFEGDLDANGQRGHHNGWRSHGLPWVQD